MKTENGILLIEMHLSILVMYGRKNRVNIFKSQKLNILTKRILGPKSFFTLQISVARICKFFDLQNFPSCFKKFKANQPLSFGFNCNPFCSRCSALMLLLSMHSNSRLSRCLLTFRIVRFAFP